MIKKIMENNGRPKITKKIKWQAKLKQGDAYNVFKWNVGDKSYTGKFCHMLFFEDYLNIITSTTDSGLSFSGVCDKYNAVYYGVISGFIGTVIMQQWFGSISPFAPI